MNHNDKNSSFPLSPENRKKCQEVADYKIEDMGGGFKKYVILSEKLKEDFRRFDGSQDFGNTIAEEEQVDDKSSSRNNLIIFSSIRRIIDNKKTSEIKAWF